MARIQYRTGDLLDTPERVILHGCNAQGRFRSGVAGAIRARYPWAYAAYMDRFATSGLRPGEVVPAVSPGGGPLILNAITQRQYGYDGRRYVDYEAIRKVVQHLDHHCPGQAVAMPLIGAGLGGGHWPTIAEIIERGSTTWWPIVYTLDGIVPG